jgi:TonB family protein
MSAGKHSSRTLKRFGTGSYAAALLVSALVHGAFFALPPFDGPNASGAGSNANLHPGNDSIEAFVIPLAEAGGGNAGDTETKEEDSGAQPESEDTGEQPLEMQCFTPITGEQPFLVPSLEHLGSMSGTHNLMAGAMGLDISRPGAITNQGGGLRGRRRGSGLGGGSAFTPPPRYPPKAREQGREGQVVLLVVLNAEGRALEVTVEHTSGHSDLDDAAMEAVRTRWRFSPGPERRDTQVLIHFDLRRPDPVQSY